MIKKIDHIGIVVKSTEELERAIVNIDGLRTGFDFTNSRAISKLHQDMEEA